MWTNTSDNIDVEKKAGTQVIKSGWVMLKTSRLSSWSVRWLVITPNACFAFACPQQSLTQATSVLVITQPITLGIPTTPAPKTMPIPNRPKSSDASEPILLFGSNSPVVKPQHSPSTAPPPFTVPQSFVGLFGKRERALSLISNTYKIWIKMCDANDSDRVWIEWLQAFGMSTTNYNLSSKSSTIESDLIHYLSLITFHRSAQLQSSGRNQIVKGDHLNPQKFSELIPKKTVKATMPLLSQFNSLDFDVFQVTQASGRHPARVVGYHCIHSLGLIHRTGVSAEKVRNWIIATERGYQDNAFHSDIHAADVTQTMYYIMSACGMVKFLEPLEMLCCIMAALTHDICHPGFTNQFLSASDHPLAQAYKPPILENYHIAQSLKVLEKSNCNVFGALSKEEQDKARHWMQELIYATDMSRHFDSRWEFNSITDSTEGFDLSDAKARLVVMQFALHCADISNPTKPWSLYATWTKRIMTEFYIQGDLEKQKGLKVSMFMDRVNSNEGTEAKCQIGFTDTFVQPLFLTLLRFVRRYCPDHEAAAGVFMTNLAKNRKALKEIITAHDPSHPPRASIS